MKKKQIFDLVFVLLVFITLSCFPFGVFIKNNQYLVCGLHLACDVLLSIFLWVFLSTKSSIKIKKHEEKNRISLSILPAFIVCFSSYAYLIFKQTFYSNFSNVFFIQMGMALMTAINEEIVFRGLIQSNIPAKHSLLKVFLVGVIVAVFNISQYLISFDIKDIFAVATGLGTGIIAGFMYEYGKNMIECVTFGFVYNVFNVYLFNTIVCVEDQRIYFLCKVVIGTVIIIYLVILYFVYFKKHEHEEIPVRED